MPTGYDPIGTVQQAIVSLLNTQEPVFLALGTRLFMSFAILLLAWYGIRWMFGGDSTVVRAFGFAELLLMISFGYAMIVFYEAPFPGIGTSFSNLITDQAGFLASTLSAQSIQNAQESLQTLPPGMLLEDQLLYGIHAVMILLTFTVGVLLVPSLTSSIFSGRSGESVLPGRLSW